MKIYLVDLNEISDKSDLLKSYYDDLTTEEKERYDKMTAPLRQRQFLVGRALIRHVCHQSPTLLRNGKPVVQKKNISLAHSGPYVVLGVDDTPLGVDVEDSSIDRDFEKLAGHMGWVLTVPVRDSFYRHFTGYESDYKLGEIGPSICHFYYSFNTFIICISTLKKIQKINFIKVIPFLKEDKKTESLFIRRTEV